MSAKTWLRSTAIMGVMVIPVLLSGCGLFSKSVSEPIDPPQTEVIEDQEQQTSSWLNQSDNAEQYIVYLQDKNGYLAPISLPVAVAEGEEVAVKLLEVMVDQGMYASSLPLDFRAMIPQGTEILGYQHNPETGIATVNLSEAFADYNGQDERSMIESITWTLTSLEGINGVELQLNGAKLEEMPVAQYPLDQPLTRTIGINIEMDEGVSYSQAAPVTLYFSSETSNNEQYYVPVTRMIQRTDTMEIAAIEELIEGPQNTKALQPVIMPDVAVTGLEEYDGVVHIDLQDDAYEPGLFVPSEMLNSIILSVAENTGVSKVQVRVNGDINIFDENNASYSQPVSKPVHVNALKL
ncbi:sporulation protein [Paenibacillus montaniterrae]|uniref:Sporulation protein n=1 Tax=Paenibacillus montaniterrae TaxID=429341 RepID=A0A919YPL1_9BACL|nr:GerMN domain-containing protein [Paenibacillus montaniterrae]GIP16992.1 sporulation protein [Paenibacillus montaniterrae]